MARTFKPAKASRLRLEILLSGAVVLMACGTDEVSVEEASVVTEETTAVTEEATVVTEEATVVAEEATVVTEEATVVTKEATVVTEEATAVEETTVIGVITEVDLVADQVVLEVCDEHLTIKLAGQDTYTFDLDHLYAHQRTAGPVEVLLSSSSPPVALEIADHGPLEDGDCP